MNSKQPGIEAPQPAGAPAPFLGKRRDEQDQAMQLFIRVIEFIEFGDGEITKNEQHRFVELFADVFTVMADRWIGTIRIGIRNHFMLQAAKSDPEICNLKGVERRDALIALIKGFEKNTVQNMSDAEASKSRTHRNLFLAAKFSTGEMPCSEGTIWKLLEE